LRDRVAICGLGHSSRVAVDDVSNYTITPAFDVAASLADISFAIGIINE